MSKTYRADSDHYNKNLHYIVYRNGKHKKKTESVKKKENQLYNGSKFDEVLFFKEIAPLVNFTGVFTEKEHRVLGHWLQHAAQSFSDEGFTTNTLMRFIGKINGMAAQNLKIREEILKYYSENPLFGKKLLNHTKNILGQLTSSELSNLLTFITHRHMYPDEQWLTIWFETTERLLMTNFEEKDLLYTLDDVNHIYQVQGFPIKSSWIHKWFDKSEVYIEKMTPEQLRQMMSLVGQIKILPSGSWIQKCMKRSSDFLNGLTGKSLFQFENAFYLDSVRTNEEVVTKWFKLSLAEMKGADVSSVMACLLPLVQNNISIPPEWMKAWIEKVLIDFDITLSSPLQTTHNISYALYALTLLQKDLEFCRPILERCNHFFKNNEKLVFDEHGAIKLRKIVFAKNYFELLGFSLCIDPNDYPKLINKINCLPKNGSNIQTMFADNLKILFGDSVAEEFKIPVIFDSVDFFIKDQNLVIEVDGTHHFIDGQHNPLTRVKTLMLEKSGYKVKRFTVAPNIQNLLGFLKVELAEHLPDNNYCKTHCAEISKG